jgi:hypothetical protein
VWWVTSTPGASNVAIANWPSQSFCTAPGRRRSKTTALTVPSAAGEETKELKFPAFVRPLKSREG